MASRSIRSCAPLALVLALLAPRTFAQTPRELLEGCKSSDVATTAATLRAAGAVGSRLCLDVLLDRRFDPGTAGRSAARSAMPHFAAELRCELASRAASESDPAWFERAIGLVGLAGNHTDVELLCELVTRVAPGDEEEDGASPDSLLRGTLVRIFERDLAKLPASHDFLRGKSEPAQIAIAGAMADVGSPRALALLAEWLARGPEHPQHVVTAISECARGLRAPFDERVRKLVRAHVESRRTLGVREAILCMGWLDDEDGAELLVQLLGHDESGVRRDALWSLQRITGARLNADAGRWSRWIAEQQRWRAEEFPRLLLALDDDDALASSAALNELLRHRFPRHELAREVASRVARLEGVAFASACAALQQLGSAAALPPLRDIDAAQRSEDEARALANCLEALDRG